MTNRHCRNPASLSLPGHLAVLHSGPTTPYFFPPLPWVNPTSVSAVQVAAEPAPMVVGNVRFVSSPVGWVFPVLSSVPPHPCSANEVFPQRPARRCSAQGVSRQRRVPAAAAGDAPRQPRSPLAPDDAATCQASPAGKLGKRLRYPGENQLAFPLPSAVCLLFRPALVLEPGGC